MRNPDDWQIDKSGFDSKQIYKRPTNWNNKNIEKLANTKDIFLAIVCLILFLLKAFLKISWCLIWINRLLKAPTTPLYWLKLTGINFERNLI